MKKLLIVTGKIAVVFGKVILAILAAFVAVVSVGHLFSPVYDFVDPKPFSGETIYNPYAGVDFSDAKKAIFHLHTTRSDGRDAPEAIVGAYRRMGYEVVGVADHDRVTPAGIESSQELGTYEHGLNIARFHSVVFGARKPDRFQLPLWQTVSEREHILKRLQERFPIVVLNHPGSVRGLTFEQLQRLSHYDYIEADGAMQRDLPAWDVALSAGHYSFVMASDDLHDLSRPYAIGRGLTFITTPSAETGDVMEALEAGHTYAVRMVRPTQNPDSLYIPRVTGFELAGDTLRVAFTDPAEEIRFVGQGGVVLQDARNTREAVYVIGSADSYVRVEARFGAGVGVATGSLSGENRAPGESTIYLNPVARYSPSQGNRPSNASYSVRNLPLTILSVVGHALLILALIAGIYLLFCNKRKPRRVK